MRFLSDYLHKFVSKQINPPFLTSCLSNAHFTGKDRTDFYEQIPIMLRELLYRLNDEVTMVLKASHAAWTALTKHVPAEELVTHIEYMQNLMASMVSEARRRKGGVGDGEFLMPGFNIPKGKFSCLL